MEQKSSGNKAHLMNRYPQIGFYLAHCDFSRYELFSDESKFNAKRDDTYLYSLGEIDKECSAWQQSLNLNNIDTLYVYGLALGYYANELKSWLNSSVKKQLIFFRRRLSGNRCFFKNRFSRRAFKKSSDSFAFCKKLG